MSVQLKVLINEADISIASGDPVLYLAGTGATNYTINSDGTDRNVHEWAAFLNTEVLSLIANNFYVYLYDSESVSVRTSATLISSITFKNEDLADAIGFTYNQAYTLSIIGEAFSSTWGTFRLVIQGSSSTNSSGVETLSRMIQPERITGKNKNDTYESIGYVINSYDKRFDMKRWKITSHWLSTDKEQRVKDFLHQAGNGKSSDSLVLYGDDHWIKDSETWLLLTDAYDGIEVDIGHKRLVVFSVGLREVT